MCCFLEWEINSFNIVFVVTANIVFVSYGRGGGTLANEHHGIDIF